MTIFKLISIREKRLHFWTNVIIEHFQLAANQLIKKFRFLFIGKVFWETEYTNKALKTDL